MSGCARILEALRDGQWHTSADLYRRCGHLILHSRISDLRHKGYVVEGRNVPGHSGVDGYQYRLVANEVRQPVDLPPVPAAEQQLALHIAPAHYDI
jgi:hypothetical protein